MWDFNISHFSHTPTYQYSLSFRVVTLLCIVLHQNVSQVNIDYNTLQKILHQST